MTVNPESLRVEFWPRFGAADPNEIHAAWTRTRSAATALLQLAAEWCHPDQNGRTPGLVWSHENVSWLCHARGSLGDVIGWLDIGADSLWIERLDPQEGAWLDLEGRADQEILQWTIRTGERLTGSPKRSTSPAPSYAQAASSPPNSEARADIDAVFEGAGLLLNALADSLPNATHPRIDAETFLTHTTVRPHGAPPLVIGLTPPSKKHTLGAWCVSLQNVDLSPESTNAGRQTINHDDSVCAFLPLTEIISIDDGEAQHERIVRFLVEQIRRHNQT